MDVIRLAEIVNELRRMNALVADDNINAAIAYLDCARWNLDSLQEIYKVIPQIVQKSGE